ncbi:hypothetical protein [Nocardioides sp. zg-1230]|uniref:hypothetical protein n=1 Tax=Nocardioides sp. zg-1230 TaxID=2736601 RepID=UPI001554CEA3|nr:hypothetical protein [Nocardioides sp. zg-1230]NPC41289.1 hypothetical protein [Nocardioides sp. zg-1230]
MHTRKVIYGVLVVIGIGVVAALRHARYNDIDVPWWAFLLALPLMVALITLDVRTRRSTATDGSETNA